MHWLYKILSIALSYLSIYVNIYFHNKPSLLILFYSCDSTAWPQKLTSLSYGVRGWEAMEAEKTMATVTSDSSHLEPLAGGRENTGNALSLEWPKPTLSNKPSPIRSDLLTLSKELHKLCTIACLRVYEAILIQLSSTLICPVPYPLMLISFYSNLFYMLFIYFFTHSFWWTNEFHYKCLLQHAYAYFQKQRFITYPDEEILLFSLGSY